MKVRILFLLLSLTLCATSYAADEDTPPSFDVEIIVFRHLSPDDTETRRVRDNVEVEPEDTEPPPPVRYQPTQTDQLRLDGVNQLLLQSRGWSPIIHYGWRQPVMTRELAGSVSIAGSRRGATVSGSARLSLERFLRLELDLEMDPGTGEKYRLLQARRLRSGETHYFDDPQFGVIVLVSPVKP